MELIVPYATGPYLAAFHSLRCNFGRRVRAFHFRRWGIVVFHLVGHPLELRFDLLSRPRNLLHPPSVYPQRQLGFQLEVGSIVIARADVQFAGRRSIPRLAFWLCRMENGGSLRSSSTVDGFIRSGSAPCSRRLSDISRHDAGTDRFLQVPRQ